MVSLKIVRQLTVCKERTNGKVSQVGNFPKVREIQQLKALAEEDIVALRNIIREKQPVMIAATTKLVIRHRLTQLIPDLSAAFERMLENGEKTDPGCRAKWAIANTLYQLEQPETPLFLAGIRHI